MPYAIKTDVFDAQAGAIRLAAQKTMYGGKHIAAGDTVYMFVREKEAGLVARANVTQAAVVPFAPAAARQTPRVDIAIADIVAATDALTPDVLRPLTNWTDGQPGTELNFKLYRQSTNKIVGIADDTAAFLDTFFPPRS